MRKAAGIVLVVIGAYFSVGGVAVLILWGMNMIGVDGYMLPNVLFIVFGAFAIGGGVLCLKRRYWGLCLVSGLAALLIAVYPIVDALLRESPQLSMILMYWVTWVLIGGAVVSIILIISRKKEWSEISE